MRLYCLVYKTLRQAKRDQLVHWIIYVCIIELLGHCLGMSAKEEIRLYSFGKELISCLSSANVREFHEIHRARIY